MGAGINKSFADLKKTFQGSIDYIKQELSNALHKDYADEMRFQSAITIATRLRMLLNDEGRNRSLLEQLHLKNKLLFDIFSRGTVDLASNLVFSASLLSLNIQTNRLFWSPNMPTRINNVLAPFDEWWNEIIIDDKGHSSKQVSRKDVVLTLCDKEGGAHLDPVFEESYYAIQFKNGWKMIVEGEEKFTENNPYAESVFVIAEEFLNTIDLYNKLAHFTVREAFSNKNLLRIKYEGINPRLKVHRFAFNTNSHLNDIFRIAYDYYREAAYSLLGLKYKRFFNQRNKLVCQFLVVDKKPEKPLYYLRKENEDRYVLLGDDNGLYRLIMEDNDIYKSEVGKPLDCLIEELKTH